jgi:hypothetical protein
MLFNLTRERCYPCKDPKKAIHSWKYRGPEFGISELSIDVNKQFNDSEAGFSTAEENSYNIPIDKNDINMLTNKRFRSNENKCSFTLSELEVWSVTF